MQRDNPFLDGLARLLTDAAGAAEGARAEFESFLRQRLEKLIADLDFVPRDEFEAVKAIALQARAENESLAKRLAVLERRAMVKKKRPQPRRRVSGKL